MSKESTFQSVEAEQQLLGALFADNALMDRIDDRISEADFYDPVHADIYRMIRTQVLENKPATPVTLKNQFPEGHGIYDLPDGVGYLVRLMGGAVQTSAIAEYASVILSERQKRDIETATHGAMRGLRNSQGVEAVAGELEDAAGKVLAASVNKPLFQSHISAMHSAVERINAAYQGSDEHLTPTGIRQLDDLIGGYGAGQLILLAGRPGMAKTTVAQNMAYALAERNYGAFFGSLEMQAAELGERGFSRGLATQGHRIPYSKMRRGQISEDEFRMIAAEAKRQQSLPLVYGERDIRNLRRLRAAVRRAHMRMKDTPAPLRVVFVDYAQRVRADGCMPGRETLNEVTDQLKQMAADLGLTVVLLSQLNREVERRDPPIPVLSDLKESGSLEEDADMVLFLYRASYYLERQLKQAADSGDLDQQADLEAALSRCANQVDVIAAKMRGDATGYRTLYGDMACALVTDDRSGYAGELI